MGFSPLQVRAGMVGFFVEGSLQLHAAHLAQQRPTVAGCWAAGLHAPSGNAQFCSPAFLPHTSMQLQHCLNTLSVLVFPCISLPVVRLLTVFHRPPSCCSCNTA